VITLLVLLEHCHWMWIKRLANCTKSPMIDGADWSGVCIALDSLSSSKIRCEETERAGHRVIRILQLHCCIEKPKQISHRDISFGLRYTFAYLRCTLRVRLLSTHFFAQPGKAFIVKPSSDLPSFRVSSSPLSYLLVDYDSCWVSRYIDERAPVCVFNCIYW